MANVLTGACAEVLLGFADADADALGAARRFCDLGRQALFVSPQASATMRPHFAWRVAPYKTVRKLMACEDFRKKL